MMEGGLFFMNCPFCGKEMNTGVLYGDGRMGGVFWNENGKRKSFFDRMIGSGRITGAKASLTTFTIESYFCKNCKKMIFDTDIEE